MSGIAKMLRPRQLLAAAALTAAASLALPGPAEAGGKAGAAALGLFGGYMLNEMVHSNRQQQQAPPPRSEPQVIYVQPQQQQAAPPPQQQAPAQMTVEQRLQRLESLRAQGLISEQEYQSQRQAVLNSL